VPTKNTADVATKRCSKCKSEKPAEAFGRKADQADGLNRWCRDCCRAKDKRYYNGNRELVKQRARASWRKHREKRLAYHRSLPHRNPEEFQRRNHKTHIFRDYGITAEQYADLNRKQDGLCAICKKPETRQNKNGTIRPLAIDHDHKTGHIRGLLCSRCNLGIGYLQDSTVLLQQAIVYLQGEQGCLTVNPSRSVA
jgi:hypothetical protein